MQKRKEEHHSTMKSSNKQNVYLFFGDEFLVKEEVQKLIENVLDSKLRDTNYTTLEGSSLDLAKLMSEIHTPSLFGGMRVVLVNEAPFLMGKLEKGEVLEKVIDNWNAKKVDKALKFFGQLLSYSGINSSRLQNDETWVTDIAGNSAEIEELALLRMIGDAFVESGKLLKSNNDEFNLEDILEKGLPKDVFLVFTAEQGDKRKKVFKTIQNRGKIVECQVQQEKYGKTLERSYFENRVKEALNIVGKTVTIDALEEMYSRTGSSMRRLDSELKKLVQYIGTRKEITKRDVENLFGDFYEAAIYELNKNLRTGDLTRCLQALYEHEKVAGHPLQSLAMIANELRRLMLARELLFTVFKPYWKSGMTYKDFQKVLKQVREDHAEIKGKNKNQFLSMKDYPIFLYMKDAQKFTMDRLADIMKAILDTDIMIKSSKVARNASNTIMEQLIFKICSHKQYH